MVTNRMLIYMTGIVIVGILILFALNISSIMKGEPGAQIYLKYNDVRGMAIKHEGKLYTLNFDQQNQVIDYLNRSIPVKNLPEGNRQPVDFEQIVIYQFEKKPDLILTPVTYLNHQLVYSMPEWDDKEYLMEMSNGKLQKIISQSFDH